VTEPVKDFSSQVHVRFKIDHVGGPMKGQPEFFTGVPLMPALDLVEFAALSEKMSESAAVDEATFTSLVKLCLTDEDGSADRFISRMRDKSDPIGFTQLMDILPWLMEQYGMRPQTPSALSSSGEPSPDGGTNSTPSITSLPVATSAMSVQPVS
jgi:hypothetical protein